MLIHMVADGFQGVANGRKITLQRGKIPFHQAGYATDGGEIRMAPFPGFMKNMQVQGRGEQVTQFARKSVIRVFGSLSRQSLLTEDIGLTGLLAGKLLKPQHWFGFFSLAGGIGKDLIGSLISKGEQVVNILLFLSILQGCQRPGAQGADNPQPGILADLADKAVQHAAKITEPVHLVDGIQDKPDSGIFTTC